LKKVKYEEEKIHFMYAHCKKLESQIIEKSLGLG
jgi:hypothetical protein